MNNYRRGSAYLHFGLQVFNIVGYRLDVLVYFAQLLLQLHLGAQQGFSAILCA